MLGRDVSWAESEQRRNFVSGSYSIHDESASQALFAQVYESLLIEFFFMYSNVYELFFYFVFTFID